MIDVEETMMSSVMTKRPAVLAWGAWALAGGMTLLGPAVASGAGTADVTADGRAHGAGAARAGAAKVGAAKAGAARTGASGAGAAGAAQAGTVPVSVRQWREVERARLEAGDCIRMQDDTERLACYDELMARRLPPSDPELGERPRGSYGLQRTESAVLRGQGMRLPAGSLPALPSLGGEAGAVSDDEAPAPMWGSAREASRAVQDVRRSLGADLTDRWELDAASDRGRFLLRPYKPMYAMAVDWTSSLNRYPSSPNPLNTVRPGSSAAVSLDPGNAKPVEAQFQVSFKSKVAEDLLGNNGDIWLAYTQMSLWQIYSGKLSRPFRETNYEPEVMAVFRTSYRLGGWRMRMASVSLNHQSNGRPQPLSRSWNRIIFQAGLERGRWTLMVRPWWRVREDAKDDDNPDINDYVGRGELVAVYRRGGHEWAGTLRHTLRTGAHARGSFNLDYAFPISSYLKAQLQIFHGYGFSLIDYNHRQTRVGLGISLVQWL